MKILRNILMAGGIVALTSVGGCQKSTDKLLDKKTAQDKIKYTPTTHGFRLIKSTPNEHLYLSKSRDIIYINITGKGKDGIIIVDQDWSAHNGIESIKNSTRGLQCYIHMKPQCTLKVREKGTQLFNYTLKELEFNKYLKRRKGEGNNFDIFGGW